MVISMLGYVIRHEYCVISLNNDVDAPFFASFSYFVPPGGRLYDPNQLILEELS